MKVLITGGSGLLGRALVSVFARDHSVVSPGHAEMDMIWPGGVRDIIGAHQPDLAVRAVGQQLLLSFTWQTPSSRSRSRS